MAESVHQRKDLLDVAETCTTSLSIPVFQSKKLLPEARSIYSYEEKPVMCVENHSSTPSSVLNTEAFSQASAFHEQKKHVPLMQMQTQGVSMSDRKNTASTIDPSSVTSIDILQTQTQLPLLQAGSFMKVEDAMSLISTAIKAAVSQVLAPIVQPPPRPRLNGKTDDDDDDDNDDNDGDDGLLCASDCNGSSLNEGLMAAMKEMVAKEVHTYMATCSVPFHGYPSSADIHHHQQPSPHTESYEASTPQSRKKVG